MKWLGLVQDPKDLTTKEYVDDADEKLAESIEDTNESLKALDEQKVNSKDISEYSREEVILLWAKHFK